MLLAIVRVDRNARRSATAPVTLSSALGKKRNECPAVATQFVNGWLGYGLCTLQVCAQKRACTSGAIMKSLLRIVSNPAALFAALTFVACSSRRVTDSTETSALVSDIRSMIQRPDGQFDVICKNGVTQVASASEVVANRVCIGTGAGSGDVVLYGRSDVCADSSIVSRINAGSDCNTLGTDVAVWSVRVNGICQDISDTNARAACTTNVPAKVGELRTLIYGRSDSCDPNTVVASVTAATDCSTLSATESAWSVRVNGVCTDISDTNVRAACLLRQPQTDRVLIYGRSDSCSENAIVASVTPATDCKTLPTDSAWSIRVGGVCQDISDTNVRSACILNQPGDARVFIYGRSDSCNERDILGSVTAGGDCQQFSDSDSAWSTKVNGVCTDISDTTARKACLNRP
jgi:hypothetical protein